MKKQGRSFLSILGGLLFFIFLRVDSWLCSLPAWITLILHFTVGLSIWWFWGTLFVWIAAGILRYLLILFGRWGASGEETPKENKNPYSAKNPGLQPKGGLGQNEPSSPEAACEAGGEEDSPKISDASSVSSNDPGASRNSLH